MRTLVKTLAVCAALLAHSVTAHAALVLYQYKDTNGGVFPIVLFSNCGGANQFCTGMVLEDVSGNPLSASPGATAPSSGLLTGGVFNSSPPAPGNGQFEPLQIDASGRLIINCGTGCGGSGGTASSFGAAFPSLGTAIGVSSGGNMIAWPAKAANTVSATDVVPEVAVANAIQPGAAAPSGSSPVSPSNLPVGAATLATAQVSVTTTVGGTQILAARTGIAGTGRVSATVCNTSTTDVWLGPSGVTVGNGQLLVGIKGACATINTTAAIFGIVGSGSETVAAHEIF